MNCLRKKFKKDPVWVDTHASEEEKANDKLRQSDQLKDKESDRSSNEDSDSDLDAYVGDIKCKSIRLEDKNILYKQLTNINSTVASSKKPVAQVKLNNKSKIALVASYNGRVDLFEIDGERNKYLQNIKIPGTKQPRIKFTPDGQSILFAGIDYNGSFYSYNMPSSKVDTYTIRVGKETRPFHDFALHNKYMACFNNESSEICILSRKSYEIVDTIRINETTNAAHFISDDELFLLGDNAHVYIWDLRTTSRCKHRFTDSGSVHSKSFAISENSNMLCIGSDSGIINSYNLDECRIQKFPQPTRVYDNIKHSVDLLEFNNTGELLVASSTSHSSSCKLINSTSGIVYKNFPQFGKSLGQVKDVSFSPLSGYLGLACSTGKAHLFRLPFYSSY